MRIPHIYMNSIILSKDERWRLPSQEADMVQGKPSKQQSPLYQHFLILEICPQLGVFKTHSV